MKTTILKTLIKEAVREVFNEELKSILLESVKGNKNPINESDMKTINLTTKSMLHQIPTSPIDAKKAYMDILNETAGAPKSGFVGEFKPTGPIDNENGSLPDGTLGLDQILKLIKK